MSATSRRTQREFLERSNRAASAAGLIAVIVVALWPVLAHDDGRLNDYVPIAIFALVAVGLNFTIGYAGEFALGQVGAFAAGAYTEAVLTTTYGWTFWNALLGAMVVGCLVGLVAGLPGLRLGGWYFAITGLFISIAVPDIAGELSVTGGMYGFGGIPQPTMFGHTLTLTETYLLSLVSLAIVLILIRNLATSVWGVAFNAMRESNHGAEAVGINVKGMKLLAYLIAAIVASYAGAIYAAYSGFISPGAFPLSLTIELIAGPVIGGLGNLMSPVVGIGILQILPTSFSGFEKYALLVYGLILIVVMIFIREGLLTASRHLWNRVALWIAHRRGWITPDEPAPKGQRAPLRPMATPSAPTLAAPATNGSGPAGDRLVLEDISKRFGGLDALIDVSLEAMPGQVTAVIGPNGSGKTTLLNIISGFYRLDRGTVSIGTTRLSTLRPHRRARVGLARTFQTPLLIPDRTARENVTTGMFSGRQASLFEVMFRFPRARRERRRVIARTDELLAFVGLLGQAHVDAGSLTAGQQRLLEIARALAGEPKILLLDEPAAGLIGAEVDALAEVVRAVSATGCVVILVEHNVSLVMDVADRITVLDAGRVIAAGAPEEIQRDPAVLAAYLGEPEINV